MTTTETPPAPRPAEKPRRPKTIWIVLGLGILFFLVGGAGGQYQGKLNDVQKNDNSSFLPESADSTKVSQAAGGFSKIQTIPGFVVYQRDGGLTATDKAKIAADARTFRTLKGVASDQVGQPQYGENDTAAVAVPLIGKNGDTSVKGPDLVDNEKRILSTAKDGAPDGLVIHSAGAGGLLVAFIDAFSGLEGSLLIAALAVVVVILLFVYRSPVLFLYPLISAFIALGAASIVIYALAKNGTITLNGQSAGIFEVLVIGAGTDYALLLISRYREELHNYADRVQAMIAAWKGAAPPIAASAATVVLGLLCLSLADLKSTSGLGPVCAIAIACTVLVMLTVLPVALVISGRWIFWPKRPAPDHRGDIADTHAAWSRYARAVTRKPRRSWVIGSVVMLACVGGLLGLRTGGLSTTQQFTDKPEAAVGQDIYDAAFPKAKGAGAPADILVDADKVQPVLAAVRKVDGVEAGAVCVQPDYAKLAAAIKNQPSSAGGQLRSGCVPEQLQVQPRDGKLLVNATLTDRYDSKAAYATVERIRAAVSEVPGADALVGGSSATNLDIQNASRHDRNLIIPIVLVVILVILGLLLRALVAPLILIATVVLSFAAALGVSSLFFNHVFGFANADPSFPLFAFVFLVALGIDYNIFLMTRVREETIEHGTREGIVRGLAVTGGVITSAGVVLAATFVVLGVLPIVFLAQIGFAVAFGVLLDTILVRSIIVPALATDIGKKIWWPSKLAKAAD